MKKMKMLILLTLIINPMTKSWGETAAETANEIAAQTTITRGFVDNLLDDMNKRTPDTRFHAYDYMAQTQETKNKIEKTLQIFETTLEKDILSKAAFWMDQYNSIYLSKNYSYNQKFILLEERMRNIKSQFEKLSNEYQTALKNVYAIIPNSTLEVKEYVATPAYAEYKTTRDYTENVNVELTLSDSTKISSSFSAIFTGEKDKEDNYAKFITPISTINTLDPKNFSGILYRRSSGVFSDRLKTTLQVNYLGVSERVGMFEILKNKTYAKYFYPQFRKKCQSSICLGLVAGDYTSLLGNIKRFIDRDIELTLADGNRLQLIGLNKDITYLLDLLYVVKYPEELPFDI